MHPNPLQSTCDAEGYSLTKAYASRLCMQPAGEVLCAAVGQQPPAKSGGMTLAMEWSTRSVLSTCGQRMSSNQHA